MSLKFGLTTRMSRVRRQADAEDGSEATVAGVLSMSESIRITKNRTMTSATETMTSVIPTMKVDECSNVRPLASKLEDHSEEHARHLAHLRALPEVRAERIAKIKKMIADGSFDTESRLSAAIDRMLEELRHH